MKRLFLSFTLLTCLLINTQGQGILDLLDVICFVERLNREQTFVKHKNMSSEEINNHLTISKKHLYEGIIITGVSGAVTAVGYSMINNSGGSWSEILSSEFVFFSGLVGIAYGVVSTLYHVIHLGYVKKELNRRSPYSFKLSLHPSFIVNRDTRYTAVGMSISLTF